ncbi:Hypothetical Protein FCC1311_038162 [Hondaea fermentalgiana]|uniref:Uncharacterized protein n=1 Tax=Hondaea fermentalgiana TaxID=2315210 RepID=A0A2R5GG20_9STRA|nr:Hypothetical Protein FCC1311_038162 [Hondaea fermentalgiana]|eukprot:GBG27593.1 Hypothetical Protein FCC1311_038162 [Hondaea fermentalgiana]
MTCVTLKKMRRHVVVDVVVDVDVVFGGGGGVIDAIVKKFPIDGVSCRSDDEGVPSSRIKTINEDLATKSDVAALKTVRNQVVDMTAALSQPKEALSAHHILLTELQVLRSAESARLEDMNSMNKESYWLRQERNAVAQGLARQQACVQEQLKVLRHLRDAFQEVNAERAALNDQAAEIFDDIKHSFLDEVEARQLDTDLPLIAPEDNSDVDSDNDREQEHGE